MEEKRGHVRVYDRLQIAYKFIADNEWTSSENPEKYFPYIWNKYPSSIVFDESEESNIKMLPHIVDLNRKIDLLIELLLPNNNGIRIEVPAERDISISGSGIKMAISEPASGKTKVPEMHFSSAKSANAQAATSKGRRVLSDLSMRQIFAWAAARAFAQSLVERRSISVEASPLSRPLAA